MSLTLSFTLPALAQEAGAGPRPEKSYAASSARDASEALPADASQPFFLLAVTYASGGGGPRWAAAADVNGDGKMDVVASTANSFGGDSVGILLGNGDGTLQPIVRYDAGGYYASVAVADVNRDGKLDVVVTNRCGDVNCLTAGSVEVLLGKGDGTFQPVVGYNGFGGWSIAVADFNGDGIGDLAIASSPPNTVGVLLGKGDGTFQAPVFYDPGGRGAQSVAAADVNRDGRPDLLVASNCNYLDCYTGTVGVLLGNADGTFQPTVSYGAGEWPVAVTVADLNGDGKLDVAVADQLGGTVGVLLGKGDGTFQSVATYPSSAIFVAVADVNGDGKPDLLATNNSWNEGEGTLHVLLGNGDGTFQPFVAQWVGDSQSLAVADLNGDGKPDLAVATVSPNGVGVMLNNTGAPPTTTALVSSVNPAAIGWGVTYTATVTSQSVGALTGTVIFQDYGAAPFATVTLAGGQAACSTTYSRAAQHSITATYSGELNKAASSTSAVLTEVILKQKATKTQVTTSGSPTYVGQPVTFTARVTSIYGAIPNGEQVTFHEGTTAIGTGATASGVAMFTTSVLTAKTHTIKATYAGDANFKPSTGPVQQVVEKYATTTALTSSGNPSTYGQAVTLTATVTSAGPKPTGKVTFKDGTKILGSPLLSGGVATLTTSKLTKGTHPITAEYLGDANNAQSTSSVVNQVVN